ncbi:hypothetical protein [uncultured Nitratireductor sp.]|uniref:hypothetical protein n=1 Tax=uncultured Nitratireductor sp. TaxID=520953 RepID=UPI0025D4E691|nr:hypothetical protein [uncultured Nitratireductor sp.]
MESPRATEILNRQRQQEAIRRIRSAVSRAFADERTRDARWRSWWRRDLSEGVSQIAMNAAGRVA